MTGNDPEVTFRDLRLEIQLLAEPGRVQIAWLIAENFPIDELGGHFSDSVQLWLPDLEAIGRIDTPAKEALIGIDDALDAMRRSAEVRLWTAASALHDAPEWQHLRDLARAALERMAVDSAAHDVMARVPPAKMIAGLRDLIQWLARPAGDQERWLSENHVPAGDLLLRLDDSASTFVPRLAPAGHLRPAARDAIVALQDFIRAATAAGDSAWPADAAPGEGGTWTAVRELARAALSALAGPQ